MSSDLKMIQISRIVLPGIVSPIFCMVLPGMVSPDQSKLKVKFLIHIMIRFLAANIILLQD